MMNNTRAVVKRRTPWHQTRTPRWRRLELCAKYGITYSGRQWRKMRKALRHAKRNGSK